MPYFDFQWTDEIIEHLDEHGITREDFASVVCNPTDSGFSRSSGKPAAWGYTRDGRYIMAVYERLDELRVLPVTAFVVRESR